MKIAFFPGCMVDMFYPEVGKSAVRVLERLGCEITLPDEQICCGQPLFNSGFAKESIPMMKNLIDAYEPYDTIVSLTGSCAYAIKKDYQRFLAYDKEYAPKIEALANRIYEFSEFIVDVLGIVNVGAKLEGKATFHKSCHMTRMLNVREQPLALLSEVEGLEYVEMKAANRCCGFGGTFSVKEPEISEQMVLEKAQNVLETGADFLVGADQACLMNIKGYFDRMKAEGCLPHPITVLHLAQVLDSGKEA